MQGMDFRQTAADGMAWDDSLLNVDDAPVSAAWEDILGGSGPMTYSQRLIVPL